MSPVRIWGRLLWKEIREASLVVIVLLVAPAEWFLLVAATFKRWQIEWRDMSSLLVAAATVVIAIWAATRADRTRKDFARDHLPLGLVRGWLASFGVPTVIAAALGAWQGLWAANPIRGSEDAINLIIAETFFLAAAFGTCYLLSATINKWAAIVAGLAIACPGAAMTAGPGDIFQNGTALFFIRTVVAAAAGTFILAALSQKKSFRTRQAASLALAAAIVFVPVIARHDFAVKDEHEICGYHQWSSAVRDGLYVTVSQRNGLVVATCREFAAWHRRGSSSKPYRTVAEHYFKRITRVVDICGRRYVYLLEQQPKERVVRVLVWDTKMNRVQRKTSIPVGKGALLDKGIMANYWFLLGVDPGIGTWGWVSPDGHYLLLNVQSWAGQGSDLWLVDLRRNRSALVMASWSVREGQVVWAGDRAILSGFGPAIAVDLRTMKGRILTFRGPGE